MAGAKGQRAIKLRPPVGQRLARPGVDQVKADPLERPLRGVQRSQPLGDVMRAPQKSERPLIQRLQAERHPVHPGAGQIMKIRRLDR